MRREAHVDNAIVLPDDGVVGTTLRWPDEFVRHKAGDIVGDLALLGGRLQAHIIADPPSHHGNVALAAAPGPDRPTRQGGRVMDIGQILDMLPHRYPFLLVDRIIEMEGTERIVGHQERHHQRALLPGALSGTSDHARRAHHRGDGAGRRHAAHGQASTDPAKKVVYFMSLDNVKFRRPVVPGDQLRLEVEMLQFRGKTCRMKGDGLRGWAASRPRRK